ncbi:MAG: hypothetical protein LM632_09535, partial [Armatimonadetes bacterium]|nr:hypothetical protein [Armatimonadota bacterium]
IASFFRLLAQVAQAGERKTPQKMIKRLETVWQRRNLSAPRGSKTLDGKNRKPFMRATRTCIIWRLSG